uniref:Uncharacterized protein n=1 Tax=Acrobeloides nanus TaxID=290746 RepID=A0A914CYN0_9BILA
MFFTPTCGSGMMTQFQSPLHQNFHQNVTHSSFISQTSPVEKSSVPATTHAWHSDYNNVSPDQQHPIHNGNLGHHLQQHRNLGDLQNPHQENWANLTDISDWDRGSSKREWAISARSWGNLHTAPKAVFSIFYFFSLERLECPKIASRLCIPGFLRLFVEIN